MYIITTTVYPSVKNKDVPERFIEVAGKYPPDENLGTVVVHAIKATEKGIKIISVTDVKPGKLEETLIYISKISSMYNDIDGFESTMDVYYKIEEAMSVLGMSMPE